MDFRNIYRENVFYEATPVPASPIPNPNPAQNRRFIVITANGKREYKTDRELLAEYRKRTSGNSYYYITKDLQGHPIEVDLKDYQLHIRSEVVYPVLKEDVRINIINQFAQECHDRFLKSDNKAKLDDSVIQSIYTDMVDLESVGKFPEGSIAMFTSKDEFNLVAFQSPKVEDAIGKSFGSAGIPNFDNVRTFILNLGIGNLKTIEWARIEKLYNDNYKKAKEELDVYRSAAKAKAKEVYTEARSNIKPDVDKLPNADKVESMLSKHNPSDLETDFARYLKEDVGDGLDWIAKAFIEANPHGIKAVDIRDYIEGIVSIEREIESNANNVPEDPEKVWKSIIGDFNSLVKKYDELMKDKEVHKMVKSSPTGMAALKSAGAAISGISFIFGGALTLLSMLPGGVQYASYFSGLAKHGRRIGKLLANAGSPLKANHAKHSKHEDSNESKEDRKLRKTNKKIFGVGKKDKHHDDDDFTNYKDEPTGSGEDQ